MKNFQDFKTDTSFHTERYEKGLKDELLVLPVLRTFFHDESIDMFEEGFTFDFYGTDKVIEFKARKNGSRDYYDTAIGANKIRAATRLHTNDCPAFSQHLSRQLVFPLHHSLRCIYRDHCLEWHHRQRQCTSLHHPRLKHGLGRVELQSIGFLQHRR